MPQIYQGNSKIFDSGDSATAQSIYDIDGSMLLVYLPHTTTAGYWWTPSTLYVGTNASDSFCKADVTTFGANGYPGAILVKLNADGTVAWRKTVRELNYAKSNNGNVEHPPRFNTTQKADVFNVYTFIDGSYVLAFNNGTTTAGYWWTPTGAYIGTNDHDSFCKADVTTFGANGYPGAALVKLNADGTVAWRKTVRELNYAKSNDGNTEFAPQRLANITTFSDGSMLLHYPIFVSVTAGNWWTPTSATVHTNATYISATVTTFGANGYPGAALVKLNADGTIAWRKTEYELNHARSNLNGLPSAANRLGRQILKHGLETPRNRKLTLEQTIVAGTPATVPFVLDIND